MAKHKRIVLLLTLAALVCAALLALSYFLNRYMEKKTYALRYPQQILAGAKTYALDAYLVAAVIHVESGNRPEIVSPKGAVGLMQIMPDTGGWICEKQGKTAFDEAALRDPDVNVDMGCWYLRYLLDRYGGNETYALAAYNAGPGNLDKWLRDETLSPGGALVRIPFKETAAYVQKVQAAREKYKELYEKELA